MLQREELLMACENLYDIYRVGPLGAQPMPNTNNKCTFTRNMINKINKPNLFKKNITKLYQKIDREDEEILIKEIIKKMNDYYTKEIFTAENILNDLGKIEIEMIQYKEVINIFERFYFQKDTMNFNSKKAEISYFLNDLNYLNRHYKLKLEIPLIEVDKINDEHYNKIKEKSLMKGSKIFESLRFML